MAHQKKVKQMQLFIIIINVYHSSVLDIQYTHFQ